MFLSNNYEKAIDLFENDESKEAKKYFLKAYEEGFKKVIVLLEKN